MNNLLSYCGLTDAIMSCSEKDLPVIGKLKHDLVKTQAHRNMNAASENISTRLWFQTVQCG